MARGRATGPARPARPGGGLQRPEHAGLVRIAVLVSRVGRALLFDQHTPPSEQFHRDTAQPAESAPGARPPAGRASGPAGGTPARRRHAPRKPAAPRPASHTPPARRPGPGGPPTPAGRTRVTGAAERHQCRVEALQHPAARSASGWSWWSPKACNSASGSECAAIWLPVKPPLVTPCLRSYG